MKILVIGELCRDKFVYSLIERLCPEAPVPVLKPLEEKSNDGMAGNVVENLKSLSPNIEVVHWHQNILMEKIRYVEKKTNHMIMRLDLGETGPIDSLSFLSPSMNQTLSESDVVIISDYNKGYLSDFIISQIGSKSKLVIMDSKKKLNDSIIENITFIKLNENEYKNNKELVDSYPEKFIITLGSFGAKYNNQHFPSPKPQETIDVSGAGDSFISSFALMYLKTKNIQDSISFANEVCSDVVSKKGVSLPDEKYTVRF